MSDVLSRELQHYQEKIKNVEKYLQETQRVFQQFGQKELKNIASTFEDIEKSLNSEGEIKLVVIGEFSRGKSTLINALLNIRLLIAAQESTTAINTFVRKLPEGEDQPYIRIHRQDSHEDIGWDKDEVLELWSTELDISNKKEREKVDYIEAFTANNPLLNQGLVLIDTPGLQSINAHHQSITERAINEAHIAIWVQSVQQLGGNATEWKFLSNTVQKNFNKFITVINMWDSVIDPQDDRDLRVDVAEREAKKYQIVKDNFHKHLSHLDESKIAQIIDDKNLIGVSAKWALDKNKIAQSNIDKLTQRIAEMLSTGEAADEVYKKPLNNLINIQQDLIESMKEEISLLNSDQSLEERKRESDMLDNEIKMLNLELETTNKNAKGEHNRAAEHLVKELENQLIQPLEALKLEIDGQVTNHYIKKEIDKGNTQISLPTQLQEQYDEALEAINHQMQRQNDRILAQLADLRVDYAKQLEKHAGDLQHKVGNIKFDLPKLELGFEIDLSEINKYMQQNAKLEKIIQEQQQEIHRLEQDKIKNIEDPIAMENAKRNLQRAELERERLGNRPKPEIKRKKEYKSHGGLGVMDFFFGKKEVWVEVEDHSNMNSWQRDYEGLQRVIADKDAYLEKLQQEEAEKRGRRLSIEAAQRKYEQEVKRVERERQKIEQNAAASKDQLIEDTRNQLVKNTAGKLKQFILQLQTQVKPNVSDVFNEQLTLLQHQVIIQLEEPLQAKLAQRQQIQVLIEQGQEQIKQRHETLEKGIKEVSDLLLVTQDFLSSEMMR